MSIDLKQYLESVTLTLEEVDRFLDSSCPNWAIFDPELGYVLRDSVMRDGIDKSYTLARYEPGGERLMINGRAMPCRINTYGNSMTQCHQVSNGETWQEYLAAHLGEPLRNFGVGGYGVYQAYRRMLRAESSDLSAPYIIFNIYEDDHFRNYDLWRWAILEGFHKGVRCMSGATHFFASNPWSHIRMNLLTGQFEERDNPYPTPDSLYKLCDKEHVYQTFKDDIALQFYLGETHATACDNDQLERVASALGMTLDSSDPATFKKTARALHLEYSLRSTMYVIDRMVDHVEQAGKKLMVLLSYSVSVPEACEGKPRFDKKFLEYLESRRIPFVDTLEKHRDDFASFRISPQDYYDRYFIGHYKPQGNHFFAFAVKDAIIDWLDPKPITYRHDRDEAAISALMGTLA